MAAKVENSAIQAVGADVIQLTLPAKSKYLAIINKVVKAIAKLLRLDPRKMDDLRVAIGEACLNVVQHAYPPNRLHSMKEELILRFLIYPAKLEIVVKDMGCGYDPIFVERYVPLREVGKPEHLKMGLRLIKKMVDEVEIDSRVGKGTQIRMTKHLGCLSNRIFGKVC